MSTKENNPKNAKHDTNPGQKLKRKWRLRETLSRDPDRRSKKSNVKSTPCFSPKKGKDYVKLHFLKGKKSASLGPTHKNIQQNKVSEQDVFCFTSHTGPVSGDDKSEVKQQVLRTIARMVQENRNIRHRYLTLKQATKKAEDVLK